MRIVAPTSRLRRFVAALGLTAVAVSCDGGGLPFSPISEDRHYALELGLEVFGGAFGSDTLRTEAWTVADTVFVRADGTGETRTYYEHRRNGTVFAFSTVSQFRYRPVARGLQADFVNRCVHCAMATQSQFLELRDGRLFRPLGRGIYPYDRVD